MIGETLRAAALLGVITAREPVISSDLPQNVIPDHQQQSCVFYRDRINCPNFEIRRTTPHADTMVDVIPRVYDWKNWRQWRAALFDGWENGLDFLYQRGCVVTGRSRNYTNAHMTVTVANPDCTGIAP